MRSHLRAVLDGVRAFLEEHEHTSVAQLCGGMSLERCPDPAAYERGNYMALLQSFHSRW